MRIAPPSLPPHHSGPATRDKLFSKLKSVTDNLSIYFGGCFTRSYTSVKLPVALQISINWYHGNNQFTGQYKEMLVIREGVAIYNYIQ